MAIKLICGLLLAAALLGCLAAKSIHKQHHQTLTSNNPIQTQTSYNPQGGGKSQTTVHAEEYHSCDVSADDRVACGETGISQDGCTSINCCWQGGQCFFAKMVTLHCTVAAEMILVVARDATVPSINLATTSLMGSGDRCNPIIAMSFVVYYFPVGQCGTVMTEESGVLIYENKLSSSFEVLTGDHGSITRDTNFEVTFQCHYQGTGIEAVIITSLELPSPVPFAALGPLRVELRLGNGQCTSKGCSEEDAAFLSYYEDGDYPVTKVLQDPVYVEVRLLERTDPNLHLNLGHCWVNPSRDPHQFPQWDLLFNGCPNPDDNYLTKVLEVQNSGLTFPSHYQRFVFRMFTFVNKAMASPGKNKKTFDVDVVHIDPMSEALFIHCQCSVCIETLHNSCARNCARKKRDIAAAKKMFRVEETTITSQQIILTSGN